ncbi:S8 family serine peptidase [uncultured Pseudodesulfovibrio sp.]|uniref:S8 family serine peptidase n=1 Tax=uncultured Pseudodesulfovibrio sp. TaxID=2035858 RepID=UPI0029C6CDC6|nr:S8 family serine peptidase [uncultured Pseudodesulfovibrio sp.]
MNAESSRLFSADEGDAREPDALNQEQVFGFSAGGEPETVHQPGEASFPEPLFGGGIGSVLDPDGGVFEAPGSYSVWEEYAEQAFAELDDLMGFADEAPGESLFGGNRADSGGSHVRHKGTVFGQVDEPRMDGMAVQHPEPLTFLTLSDFPVGNFGDDDYYDNASPQTAATSSNDPLFSQQWYIQNTSGGVDLNVVNVWDDYTGKGIKVGICDNGVEYTHPDLSANYLLGQGYNSVKGINDGAPEDGANHGTQVAGFVAAAKNGIGIQGIAYDAKIASFVGDSDAQVGDVLARQTSFDISQNSWTFSPFDGSSNSLTGFETLAVSGRGGLGTVSIVAGSNERGLDIMSTYYDTNDSPYTIAIGAVSSSGQVAEFSCAGPNLLATAPGEDVITTDRVAPNGDDGSASYYTGSGTSYSSPLVSGVVALMLEANKSLGYRDVMDILASTAVKTSGMTSSSSVPWDWQTNTATNWNGGGMHFNHDYGFGLVDARAAVRLAESWDQGAHTYANQVTQTVSATVNSAIPDNTGALASSVISVGTDIEVQQACVAVDVSHSNLEHLEIVLYSPGGTASVLFYHPTFEGLAQNFRNSGLDVTADQVKAAATHTFGDSDVWTFKTVAPFGESGQGDWTLTVKDTTTGETGTFNSWTLNLYGDAVTHDDLYVYTDEFSDNAASDAGRKVLADASGTDTLNAAAVTSDSSIDLAPGGTSTVDGVTLTIDAGTTIENAQTGDGNDTILGNSVDNALFGWRGNDVLFGLGGNDTLGGGSGSDKLTGGIGNDIFMYKSSAEGKDIVADFSHVDDCFNFVFGEFGQSGAGTLTSDHFFNSVTDVDVSDACFVFDGGVLFYDSDGTGADVAVEIAQVLGDTVQADDVVFV